MKKNTDTPLFKILTTFCIYCTMLIFFCAISYASNIHLAGLEGIDSELLPSNNQNVNDKDPSFQMGLGTFYHRKNQNFGLLADGLFFREKIHYAFSFRYRNQNMNLQKRENREYSLFLGVRYYTGLPVEPARIVEPYWQLQLGFINLHDRDYIRPVYDENVIRFAGSVRISYGMHLRITNNWLLSFELPLEVGHAAGYPEPPHELNFDITRSYNFVTFLPAISVIYRIY